MPRHECRGGTRGRVRHVGPARLHHLWRPAPRSSGAATKPVVAFVPATAGSKAGGGLKARPTRLRQFVAHGV